MHWNSIRLIYCHNVCCKAKNMLVIVHRLCWSPHTLYIRLSYKERSTTTTIFAKPALSVAISIHAKPSETTRQIIKHVLDNLHCYSHKLIFQQTLKAINIQSHENVTQFSRNTCLEYIIVYFKLWMK